MTRQEQWMKYKRRAIKHRRHLLQHKNFRAEHYHPVTSEVVHHTIHKWTPSHKTKLKPLSYYLKNPPAGPAWGPPAPVFGYMFAPAKQHEPPFFVRVPPAPHDDHRHLPDLNYHHRAVTRWGRSTRRSTKVDRMNFGAKLFFHDWGLWPHWDPSMRTPFMHDDEFAPRSAYGLQLDAQR